MIVYFIVEWTIVQMSREFNPMSCFQSSQKIAAHNSVIYLSIICYTKWDLNNQEPICLKIDPLDGQNIYTEIAKFTNLVPSAYTLDDVESLECRRNYAQQLQNINTAAKVSLKHKYF